MILYIDPGTGSMLVTVLISLVGTAVYFIKNLIIKIKFSSTEKVADETKIPLVIFSDHKRYWNLFEPICNELEKRKIDCVFMTESEDDPALSKNYEHIDTRFIGSGSKAYAKLNILKAGVVFATTPSLDVYQWKRSKYVDYYIHIPHAAKDITLYRMFGIDCFDAILISGEYQREQIRKLEEIRNLSPKEICCVGVPYLDEMKKRYESIKSENNKKSNKTVLLAPSWGDNGILKKYGREFLDKLIATGYNIIVRPHPQSYTAEKDMIDSLKRDYPDEEKFHWNEDNDNFDVLSESDILISDFSGVIIEYALVFDKPVIYTDSNFDKSIYDAAWLDDGLWTFDILPSIGTELSVSNFNDIKKIIDECVDSEEFSRGREKARNDTWAYIGEGAVRTVDFLKKCLDKQLNNDQSEVEEGDQE